MFIALISKFYSILNILYLHNRVPVEEEIMIKFYGQQYTDYMRNSFIGIPFVSSPSAIEISECIEEYEGRQRK